MKEFLQSISAKFQFLHALDLDGFLLWNNPPSHWIMALLVAVTVGFLLRMVMVYGIRRLHLLSSKTETKFDDFLVAIISKTKQWFFLILAFYVGLGILDLGAWDPYLNKIMMTAFLLQSGLWVNTLVLELIKSWSRKRGEDGSVATAMIAMRFVAQVVVWSLILLLILDNLGVKVISLVAGLGVGGIALALAVQRVLGDLLASISIVLDRPFEIGDTIIVGEIIGTVEHIGLKTTRLRSVSGEQLIMANSDLLDSRIRNMKRMKERRNVLVIGVTYQTPASKLALIPEWLKAIVESQTNTRFDRAHFKNMGDFALQFELAYWIESPELLIHMDLQQKILLEIFQKFEQESVEFAYPTQTVFVNKKEQN